MHYFLTTQSIGKNRMGIKIKKNQAKANSNSSDKTLERILSANIFGSRKLKDKEKEGFYQYLSTLVSSRLQLPIALKLYAEEEMSSKAKMVADQLLTSVTNGSSLSKAMNHTAAFDPYEYYNIEIGEETGRLEEVLIDLKRYYENKIRQSRKIKSVMVYPAVVLSISFLAVWFLLSYVVPLFVDVYKRFGGELPAITQMIIAASVFLKNYSVLILLSLLGIFISYRMLKPLDGFQKISSRIILRLPVLGNLLRQVYLARFCNSMHLMLKSRITFLRSLEMSNKMIGFYPIREALPLISTDILKGGEVNEAFAKHAIFDKQMITLLKVGEEVNKLDEMFGKLSTTYEENVNHNFGIINTLIEPFIIVFLGLVIGFILIAMYLPLFSMGNQMVS